MRLTDGNGHGKSPSTFHPPPSTLHPPSTLRPPSTTLHPATNPSRRHPPASSQEKEGRLASSDEPDEDQPPKPERKEVCSLHSAVLSAVASLASNPTVILTLARTLIRRSPHWKSSWQSTLTAATLSRWRGGMAIVPHSLVWRHSLRAAPAASYARQRAWAAPRTPEGALQPPRPQWQHMMLPSTKLTSPRFFGYAG
jgi:hypothetical protein